MHTAAWPGDPSAEDIRRVHVEENGWDDIGYHFVVRKDGTVEAGRPVYKTGAHCRDMEMNHRSVGICLSGHHDHDVLHGDQLQGLLGLIEDIRNQYNIPAHKVIGHRETGAAKSCPGEKVDMVWLRDLIRLDDQGLKMAKVDPVFVSDGESEKAKVKSEKFEKVPYGDRDLKSFMPSGKKPVLRNIGRKALAFLKGENKSGKVFHRIGIVGIAAVTGYNIEPILNTVTGGSEMETALEFLPQIIEYGSYVLLFLIGLFVKKPGTMKWIRERIQSVSPEITEAVHKDSEGGKKITPNEVEGILKAAFSIEDQPER